MKKTKILFLCKDNSIRSQIAAGFLNKYFGDRFEAYSAGVEPQTINPYVFKVMAEMGVDISKHHAKSLEEFSNEHFDYIVTLCDYARTFTDRFPKHNKLIHKKFPAYCVAALCDHARKFELCFPENKKPMNKMRKQFYKGSDTEEEILTILRCLKTEIMEWLEKEALF